MRAWEGFELESCREDLVGRQSPGGGWLLLGAAAAWIFRAMVQPGFAIHGALTVLAPALTVVGALWVAVMYFRRPNPTTTPFLEVARHRPADVKTIRVTRFELRTKSGPRVSERVMATLADGTVVSSHALPSRIIESVLRTFPGAAVTDTRQ